MRFSDTPVSDKPGVTVYICIYMVSEPLEVVCLVVS